MRVTSNKDLQMIHNGAFQVKIKFNPGPTKSAQEVIFKSKTKKKYYLIFPQHLFMYMLLI